MFPGKKAGTKYSFGEIKGGSVKEHEVTKAPALGRYPNCTIAQYSNIVGGEHGERKSKIHHLHHHK